MTGMKDIIREMPMKPEKEESGELFSKSWWYRCPVCHDPLDYKQPECGWCHQKINWDGEQKEIMTTLVLPIKKQWFDMIRNHKKLEEYREIKPYWTKRFLKIGLITSDEPNHIVTTMNKALVTFRNGYGKDAQSFRAWVHMDIGRGMVSWGAIPGKLYYTLIIDKVVET